ncbi:MAG: hypothetical protein JXR91_15410 [Deltaproteobacteria bacterium]|nr:hypothetical protein [Deltaproteobacteria bacterium]
MKYRCNQCDITFESEKKDKIRCPECMGIHGIEKADEKSPRSSSAKKKGIIVPLIILAALAGLGVVYFYTIDKEDSENLEGAKQELSSELIKSTLKKEGIDIDTPVIPFETTDIIKKFASIAEDKDSDLEKAEAIYNKLSTLKNGKKWVPEDLSQPMDGHPITADQIAESLLKKDTAALKLTPYEITSLLYATLKSLDAENCAIVEIYSYKEEKRPSDPYAVYSSYGVVINDNKKETIFDPFNSKKTDGISCEFQVLSSFESVAPYYALKSLSYLSKMDMQNALKENSIAVTLAPQNAIYKIHRGRIFLSSGGASEASTEFEKAKKVKDWGITKIALAQISLMTGKADPSTEADIRDTLKQYPAYFQAHLLLGGLFMTRGDMENAKKEFETAMELAPFAFEVAQGYAQFYLINKDTENAIAMGKKAVRLSKGNLTSLMILAQIYRATARFDEMRETAKKALEKAASETVKEQIKMMFNISESDQSENNTTDSEPSDTDSAEPMADSDMPIVTPPEHLKLNLKHNNSSPSTKPMLGNGLKLNLNN